MPRLYLAAAIMLLLGISTPISSFAQEEEFFPDSYTGQQSIPADAYGAAYRSSREHRRERPSDTVVDPETGDVIGADPDPNIRSEMERDPPSDRGR